MSIPEAVRVIGEEDPVPLSSGNRRFRGDLDTMAAKALEKDKDRRYPSERERRASPGSVLTPTACSRR